jgi:hypothetical protein
MERYHSNDQFGDACDLDALLHPSQAFDHPSEVVSHPAYAGRKTRDPRVLGFRCMCDRDGPDIAPSARRKAPCALR